MVRTSRLGWDAVSECLVTSGLLVGIIRWEALGWVDICGGLLQDIKCPCGTLGICVDEYT